MKRRIGQTPTRSIFVFLLICYLATLITFVFFPRPVLVNGSPSDIAEYLQTHASIFYKILYADARLIAIANFFMLTPLVIVTKYVVPTLRKRKIFFLGISLSLAIELTQIVIPGRVPDFADLISNGGSVIIGLLLVRFLQRKQ